VHFFFYGMSVALYTVAVFVAGMYLGEKLERAWARQMDIPNLPTFSGVRSRSRLRR
jgi:hypothetical protein